MAKQRGIRLRGSDRKPVPGAKVTGVVDPKEHIEITIRLRRQARISDEDLMQMGAQKPRERAPALSREEFTKRFGANPADVARIEAFAHEYGLVVTDSNIGQGTVRLKGSVGSFNAAFGVKLRQYEQGGEPERRGLSSVGSPGVLQAARYRRAERRSGQRGRGRQCPRTRSRRR